MLFSLCFDLVFLAAASEGPHNGLLKADDGGFVLFLSDQVKCVHTLVVLQGALLEKDDAHEHYKARNISEKENKLVPNISQELFLFTLRVFEFSFILRLSALTYMTPKNGNCIRCSHHSSDQEYYEHHTQIVSHKVYECFLEHFQAEGFDWFCTTSDYL